jgi:hypothetical protein
MRPERNHEPHSDARLISMRFVRHILLTAVCVICLAGSARAQGAAQTGSNGWDFAAYPLFVWLPVNIGIDVEVPSDGGAITSGEILDSQFDGAFFAGINASNGVWRIEGFGIWASFGGDRPDNPSLQVDLDLLYGDARVGRRFAPDFYVTGGIRRVALDYEISVEDLPEVTGKPGVWDPLVGVGWHRVRPQIEFHGAFEAGGFGVGADIDLGGSFRVDWKPIPHFGLAAGYNFVYLKISDSIGNREVVLKPLFHGPAFGFGLYF